ncbi:MAG: alkaline phosphatase family protein [Verrucomicrobiota bacterium]
MRSTSSFSCKKIALPADEDFPPIKLKLDEAEASLRAIKARRVKWSAENFEKLSEREKNLHNKAFCTNTKDPFYHELASLRYRDGKIARQLNVPKGDVLHQFRQEVERGELPAVSWIVAPENFSDHPSSAWFGAWYLSEVMALRRRPTESGQEGIRNYFCLEE